MSAPRSKLRKILRATERKRKKGEAARERYRKPGETDEQMEERMKRDLGGWLEMMTERDVEEGLLAAAEKAKQIESAQDTTPEEK